MAQFIKDYGSILSPTIAFVLGIFTMLLKYYLDSKIQKKQTYDSFEKAKEMLSKIRLPDYCEGSNIDASCKIFSAATARNLTNISRMYFSVSATYQYLLSLESEINKSKNLLIINQYFYLVWRVKNFVQQLKSIRDSQKISASEWYALQNEIPELLNFLHDDWFAMENG